jgi:hypothetical protein
MVDPVSGGRAAVRGVGGATAAADLDAPAGPVPARRGAAATPQAAPSAGAAEQVKADPPRRR